MSETDGAEALGIAAASLDRLHTLLGDLNDGVVGRTLLERFPSATTDTDKRADENELLRQSQRKGLKAAWRQFRAIPPPWSAQVCPKAA